MADKVKTIKYQGRDYAQVSDRLKVFREECPNGLIETEPIIQDDGQILFKARILKDKNRPESGEATGHALGKDEKTKSFEKLETVAVGRALALLGYMASGEIASSDEMAEFMAYKEEKINDVIDTFKAAETIEDLKRAFMDAGTLIAEKRVIEAKDTRKAELEQPKLDLKGDKNASNKS